MESGNELVTTGRHEMEAIHNGMTDAHDASYRVRASLGLPKHDIPAADPGHDIVDRKIRVDCTEGFEVHLLTVDVQLPAQHGPNGLEKSLVSCKPA